MDPYLIKEASGRLDKDLKKDITAINLSRRMQSDNAIVAGLNHANGGYTVIFDMNLYKNAGLIVSIQ